MLSLLLLQLLSPFSQAAGPAQSPAPKPFDCTAPEYRQFDFWVGEWDLVPNPETRPAAAAPLPPDFKPMINIVTKAHGGCVIVETFDDQRGFTGQSFNIFDRFKRQWHQTWVDSGGGLHEYWGELKDGRMVYLGEVPFGPAQPLVGRRTMRVTFVPLGPNRMRQYSELLTRDGTWIPGYDFIYTRRVKPPAK